MTPHHEVEVAVDQRPRVRPLVADVAAALLAGVRDDPALGLPEAVDLHLGDVDPATGEGLVELRGPPRSAQPLLGDSSLLLVGEGGCGRPTSGGETGHDPRLAPSLKEALAGLWDYASLGWATRYSSERGPAS